MGIAADFVLIVVAGLAGGIVARAVGVPLLVGYIAAGVVVGPHTAGPTVANIERDRIARRDRCRPPPVRASDSRSPSATCGGSGAIALIGGPIQIGLTALFGAWVARTALAVPTTDAIWFGAMVSLSSTMVVLKIAGRRRHHLDAGEPRHDWAAGRPGPGRRADAHRPAARRRSDGRRVADSRRRVWSPPPFWRPWCSSEPACCPRC